MFDEVLKFGSMIVDALVAYQQPLFVYIPPFAELRGGAWVVVDSTINSDVMEFYAAEDARGGVLEAAGAASIKFRDRDIAATAHRIDPTLIDLDARLASSSPSSPDRAAIEAQIKQREKMLFGVYQQVAVHFADLHDTPGRMKSKGVIRRQVDWCNARTFFYWRLRRRLFEFAIANKVASASTSHALKPGVRKELIADLQAWFGESGGGKEVWEDDKQCVQWLEKNQEQVQSYLVGKHMQSVATKLQDCIATLSDMGDEVAVNAWKAALNGADAKTKKALLAALN
jgi:acetyl-CoA carboxylase/biotin carboxylase 1